MNNLTPAAARPHPVHARDGSAVIALRAGVSWCVILCSTLACAQETVDPLPPDPTFPDGISPSHVYAKVELLARSLEALIEKRNVRVPSPPQAIESDLKPMHVYQAVLTCTWRLQELDDRIGVPQIPYISARPRTYAPRDVHFIVNLILDNVRKICSQESVVLPTDERSVPGKSPTDVFNRCVEVFIHLNALCDYDDLTPSEVFAQVVRAEADVKSILQQADPACRYRIDAPQVPPNAKPADAFAQCLEIRRQINKIRRSRGMPEQPVPDPPSVTIKPSDVFLQTQIIIAELNLIKLRLHTVSSTPLTIPVAEMTPTDVHQKAALLMYLLEQVHD